jgi:methylthioribose-1-phosphate isomerase
MKGARIDLVLVGADRIARNGDVANKIGTYGLALAAQHHGVPFYVAAPGSTIDPRVLTGEDIPIEQRPADEVRNIAERPVTPPEAAILNPAFDVTPARFITGYLTDCGFVRPPFE